MYGGDIHEKLIMEMADAMVSTGMKDAGYQYVVIDDHWHGGRDKNGLLYPDAQKFPSGIKALADYVHSKGLKFGIYSDAGTKTCGGEPGSFRHEENDARTFASWGVDFLKYDYCNAPDNQRVAIRRYTKMADALRAAGRPIVFSVCEWGPRQPWLWARQAGGHLWRTTFDIIDCWDCSRVHSNAGNSVLTILDLQEGKEQYAGPGGWNDPDMLIVGLCGKGMLKGGGCTDAEYRAHMSLWCLLAAPLMTACDLRSMSDFTLQTLTNREVLAVNQDPLGKQGFRVWRREGLEVWKKPLSGGSLAVGLFNRSENTASIEAKWADLEISCACSVRDLWEKKDLGVFETGFSAEVPSRSLTLLRVNPGQASK
jgi:alpha-galactosidase